MLNQPKQKRTVEEQIAELESLILENGLLIARSGGLNEENLPGLDRALALIKIRRRQRRKAEPAAKAQPQTIPAGASLAQVIAESRVRYAQLGAAAEPAAIAAADKGIIGMPVVTGEAPVSEAERRVA